MATHAGQVLIAQEMYYEGGFVVLDHDFTLEAGDLTATLKVRRDRIVNRYANVFGAMYETQSLLRRSFTIIQMLTRAPTGKRPSES